MIQDEGFKSAYGTRFLNIDLQRTNNFEIRLFEFSNALNHTRCAFSHPPSTKKEQRYTVQVTSTKNKYEILNDNVTICLYYRCKYLSPVSLLLTTYSRRNFIILALISFSYPP